MPNHCYIRLTVEGDPAELERFVEQVRGKAPDWTGELPAIDFERHVPTPPELLEPTEVGSGRFPDWYSWRREHWGTKWTAQCPEVVDDRAADGVITYSFWTAYSPPSAWLARVSDLHRKLRFRSKYCEELGHFAGRAEWQAGFRTGSEALDPYEVDWMEWQEVKD